MNILIFHASFAGPESHWYPWLKNELENQGHRVFVPRFPSPEHQSLGSWHEALAPYRQHIGPETLIIGHGTGCAFALRVLEESETPVTGCLFVAPFVERVKHEGLNLVNATFVTGSFDWHATHQKMGRVMVFAADNDPFVGIEYSRRAAELLGVEVSEVAEAGHFTEGDGWLQAPQFVTALDTLTAAPESPEQEAFDTLNQELEASGIGVTLSPEAQKKELDDASYTPQTHNDPMQTMYEDISETINTANAKYMADMLRKERSRETGQRARRRRLRAKIAFGILGIALVIIGVVLVRRGIDFEPPAIQIEQKVQIPSLVPADKEAPFVTDDIANVFAANERIGQLVSSLEVPQRHVLNIYPKHTTITGARLLNREQFLDLFEIDLPAELASALNEGYMYGKVGGEAQAAFLLLSVASIDRAFVGMREWEDAMIADLEGLLVVREDVRQPSLYLRAFRDDTIDNYPVRVLEAPRVVREARTTQVTERLQAPTQHALPPASVARIQDINDTSIIFAEPDEFIQALEVGDIITAAATPLSGPFIRQIEDFILIDGTLAIQTRSLKPRELIANVPEGAEVVLLPGQDGELQRFVQYEKEEVTYQEYEDVPVLYYLFLDNEHVLITTGMEATELLGARI